MDHPHIWGEVWIEKKNTLQCVKKQERQRSHRGAFCSKLERTLPTSDVLHLQGKQRNRKTEENNVIFHVRILAYVSLGTDRPV